MSRIPEAGTPAQAPVLWVLADTSPAGQKGSMARYARLVEQVLEAEAKGNRPRPGAFTVKRVALALPERVLAFLPKAIRSWVHHAWILGTAFFRLRFLRADLVHILDGSHAYIAGWIPRSVVSIATSHDIIPFLQLQQRFPVSPPGRLAGLIIRKSLQGLGRVDGVMADSHHTRADLIAAGVQSEKIDVVPLAAPYFPAKTSPGEIIPWRERRQAGGAYMLHVGNNSFYKNRAGVLRIFSRVQAQAPGLRLKMAGPAPSEELKCLLARLDVTDSVDFVIDPSDAEIDELYRRATLFLFPSIYEGFGWPPLEAMAAGCPVVCSNAASLPEVVGQAALTGPPEDIENLASLCLHILRDEELAARLIDDGRQQAAKFTTARMARDLLSVYSRAGIFFTAD